MSDFTVTIARDFGCGGRTIGKMLAGRLTVRQYHRARYPDAVSGKNTVTAHI